MKTLLITSFVTLLSISCEKGFSDYSPYRPPEFTNDGLEVGTLAEVGIDTQIILDVSSRIQRGKYKEVHSMLIYKDNKLVFEEYYTGHKYQWDGPGYHGEWVQWNKDMLHHTMSCSKSFTSACIGIAIDEGYIGNVHESIFNYLPDHQQFNNNGKEKITIEHLVTMTSGLKWNEWNAAHGTSANDIDRIYFECSNDPVACVLERPLEDVPGEVFTYNGGGIIILSEILKNASHMNLDQFSMKFLFKPLGIDSTTWYQFENGSFAAEGSLYLTPRDMLKFGVTFLDGGTWHGMQVVPENWVEKGKVPYNNNKGIKIPIDDSGRNGYSYTWWTNELSHSREKAPMFSASGWGGQSITVIPDENMVVIFTGGNYAGKKSLHEIMERYVLPSTF